MKCVTKEKRKQRTNLEKKLKKLEGNLDEDSLSKYNCVKNELGEIYYHISEDARIRSKCDKHGEKLTIFFFEFRKTTRISKYNKNTCC